MTIDADENRRNQTDSDCDDQIGRTEKPVDGLEIAMLVRKTF